MAERSDASCALLAFLREITDFLVIKVGQMHPGRSFLLKNDAQIHQFGEGVLIGTSDR